MPSKLEFFLGIVVFIAVLSAAIIVFLPKEQVVKHAFEAVEGGVLFYSEEKSPREFLLALKDSNEFYIVLESKQGSNSGKAANAFITLQAVLTASGKKVTSVVQSFSESSVLQGCQTNRGMVGVSDSITVKECIELLKSNASFIIIEQPSGELKTPEVKLEKAKAYLKPKTESDVQSMVFLVLKAMFADSEEKIKQINEYWQNRASG